MNTIRRKQSIFASELYPKNYLPNQLNEKLLEEGGRSQERFQILHKQLHQQLILQNQNELNKHQHPELSLTTIENLYNHYF